MPPPSTTPASMSKFPSGGTNIKKKTRLLELCLYFSRCESILYSVFRISYSVFCILYFVFRIPYSVFHISYFVFRNSYFVFRIPYSVERISSGHVGARFSQL